MKNIIDWTNKPFAANPEITERIVYFLIFLFPIAGMSVKHWITNIFNILALIALFSLRKPREPLLKQERIFLWICAAYFGMFLISSFVNGWEQEQTYHLGTELRFLLVIPLYLLLRRYENCTKWLIRGAIVGGFILFAQAFYDIAILEFDTARGVYSKNIIGPSAVLVSFWSLYYLWANVKTINIYSLFFILLSIILALSTVGLSGSRGAYVSFLLTATACILFFSKPRWMFLSIAGAIITSIVLYQNVNIVKDGVNTAVKEIPVYFQAPDHTKDPSSTTSTGVRFEMFRTSALIVRDNPLTGIGPGNYRKTIKTYIDKGEAHPILVDFKYPHNTFLEVLTAKGFIGLLTVLLIFYYPAYLYIKGYKSSENTAVIGLIQVTAMTGFSLTDHSVVLMNNYTSILLLALAIFLSSHLRSTSTQSK